MKRLRPLEQMTASEYELVTSLVLICELGKKSCNYTVRIFHNLLQEVSDTSDWSYFHH